MSRFKMFCMNGFNTVGNALQQGRAPRAISSRTVMFSSWKILFATEHHIWHLNIAFCAIMLGRVQWCHPAGSCGIWMHADIPAEDSRWLLAIFAPSSSSPNSPAASDTVVRRSHYRRHTMLPWSWSISWTNVRLPAMPAWRTCRVSISVVAP